MDPTPDLSLAQLTKFLRQHMHDVCNDLNGLDLETVLLTDFAPASEARESIARIRAQIRRLAGDLRAVSAKFAEPNPIRAPYAASELFLIWQDQLATIVPEPTVRWSDALGTEQVNVDASALAVVFRELLTNAQAFGTGETLLATAQMEDGHVAFDLREPKDTPLDPATWGSAPFASVRHSHYGLGLWAAQRTITANGGEVRRHFAQDAMELITTLVFPVV